MMELDMEYVQEILGYEMDDLRESFEHPVIIHFLSGFYNRPWTKNCSHPLRGEFHKYKELSPWKDELLISAKLPIRLRVIGKMMEVLGPRATEKIRKLIKRR